MIKLSHIPHPALLFGAAGLLPALACLGVALAGPPAWRDAAFLLATIYAGVILSFLGGAWWGLSCAPGAHPSLAQLLLFSVAPPLAAWAAIYFLTRASLIVMAILFVASLVMDRRLLQLGLAPPWWFDLRLPLSAGMAILSLLIALVA